MKRATVKLTGESPLLMHSDRSSDPLSSDARWLSEIAKKRTKSDDEVAELARREWHCSIYRSKERPFLPVDNLHSCLYAAAKRRKEGPIFAGSVIVERATFHVLDAPDIEDWTCDTLWEISQNPKDERSWVDRRSVRVGQSRVQRTRAIFHKWSVDVVLLLDDSPSTGAQAVDIGLLQQWLLIAGSSIGLGDYRPQKGGLFGRFTHQENAAD